MQEQFLLIAAGIGIMIGLSLLSQVFTKRKANFFLGIVILLIAIELLFSWGAQSGYNNQPNAIPFWLLLNYNLSWPALWLFIKYQVDDNFQFKQLHLWLFLPAALEWGFQFWFSVLGLNLIEYTFWPILSEYIPVLSSVAVLVYFWVHYTKYRKTVNPKLQSKIVIAQLRLLTLMIGLSIMVLFWIVFSFIGWEYFQIIEYIISITILILAFLHFMDSQSFAHTSSKSKSLEFPNFEDDVELKKLNDTLIRKELFLKPNLPLKELALELGLPSRYVSYLINQYLNKNYKEYINQFRINYFLDKAATDEKNKKTLLALALESGFSSKSTFNQVFKTQMGSSPSDYLKST